MNPLLRHARQVALCIVDTAWDLPSLRERLGILLDGGPPDPDVLAARLVFHCGECRSPPFERIVEVIAADEDFRQQYSSARPRPLRLQPGESRMQATPDGLLTLPLPRIPTLRHLAMWLGLSDEELEWFGGIDRRMDPGRDAKLNHYRYEWQARGSGAPRLLEKPKPRLKALQREILKGILERVPAHDAAHGFRRHRSCRTSVGPHIGRAVLLRMDLKDFFHSVGRARAQGVFRTLGYPTKVAASLAGICTHRTALRLCGAPAESLSWEARRRLGDWHLPQGAPSSPALANLCAWRLDTRLTGLAQRFGLRYTRYADDMAISGDTRLSNLKTILESWVGAIALEEGFRINHRKTRWMHASQRQRFCGITVNAHPNLERREYDRLKATLYNCVRRGPAAENRAGHPDFRRHLEGRVSHAVHLNPQRGRRLQRLLAQIRWPS
jgi:hypothetical protein